MRTIGRYALHDAIASGGMGTVHLGQLLGEGGFSRPVAIKCLHPHLARQEEFVVMFMDEARLAARVRHPNVLPTVDVVLEQGELFVVMEYVHGAPLAALLQKTKEAGRKVPLRIASSIATGILQGLHAAHEAMDEKGRPLGIVHRDVSPQNVLVGADGATRVLDFGVAKAAGRLQASTGEGMLKGKIGYLAPEQVRGLPIDRATDIYSASVVLWELLTGKRLFPGENEGHVLEQILVGWVDPPSKWVPEIPEELDAAILKGLASDPTKRFRSARDMAMAIERSVPAAPAMEVGEWVDRTAWDLLEPRAKAIAAIEHRPSGEMLVAGVEEPKLEKRAESPSTISVSKPAELPRRRRWGAVVAFLLTLTTVLLWFFWPRRPAPSAKPEPAAVATYTAPVSVSEAASAIEAPPVVPLEVEDLAPPSTTTKAKAIAKPKAPATPPVAPSANPDCSPPWTVDSLGRRIYKRQCLHSP